MSTTGLCLGLCFDDSGAVKFRSPPEENLLHKRKIASWITAKLHNTAESYRVSMESHNEKVAEGYRLNFTGM